MKSGPKDPRPARRLLPAALLLAAGAATLALSCQWPDPYPSQYYDTSYNFISDRGFDAFIGDDSTGTSPEETPGSWDFAWRGTTGTTGFSGPDGEYPYMTLSQATDIGTGIASDVGTVPDGLAADAPIYRLSYANLFVDGDFGEGAGGTGYSAWSGYYETTGLDPGNVISFLASGDPLAIHEDSLRLDLTQYNWARLALDNCFLDDATTTQASYFLGFRYYADEAITGSEGGFNTSADPTDATDPLSNWSGLSVSGGSSPAYAALTSPELAGSGGNGLWLTSSSSNTLRIDDIVAARADVTPRLRMLLRPTDVAESDTPLLPGRYAFSVWVAADASASDPDASSAAEPYRSRFITLKLAPVDAGAGGSIEETFDLSDLNPGEWRKLTVSLDATALTFDESATDPVMELRISFECRDSTLSLIPYPGALIIAAPSLNYQL